MPICYEKSHSQRIGFEPYSTHRGEENRLDFAIQLCYMRYPGIVMPDLPDEMVIQYVASQLNTSPGNFDNYGKRKNTFHEHSIELQTVFGFKLFSSSIYEEQLLLEELGLQTDKGIMLAMTLIANLRSQKILLPSVLAIEELCAEAITNANRQIYGKLTDKLSEFHRKKLDDLLKIKPDSKFTWLAWLRQSPKKVSTTQILEHIERLKKLNELQLTEQIKHTGVHQNRLLKIAREGFHMTVQHLIDFEDKRRYATLVALVIESTATITDEIIDLHDRIIEKLFSTAKNTHQNQFQKSGKAINNQMLLYSKIGQVLLEAKQNATDQKQAYRAGGLALVTSAIVLWNTVYMEKSVQLMSERGDKFELDWCKHLSPLGWEHIGFNW